jgi:hypothetical protein
VGYRESPVSSECRHIRLVVTRGQRGRVLRSLQWLREHLRPAYEHIRAVAVEIRSARPGDCPPWAGACTGGHLGPVLAIVDLDGTSDEELIVKLVHESRHWTVDRYGKHVIVWHQCTDGACSRPEERYADPIYAGDDRVRSQLAQPVEESF